MAMAMVSTPDVAKDLFSGLWEQNTDLYQAYQNLGDQTSYATSASATNAGYNVVTTSYIPMSCASTTTTSSYIPAARAPTTAYIPTTSLSYTPATKSSYIPATTYRPPADAASTAAPSRYSPKTAATSRYSPNSRLSPASCGSSTCSDASKPETFEVNTSDYTKLALVLISQSQKKKYSREEEEKRRVRRERNKVAATKCRIKRRAHSTNIGTEYNEVMGTQKQLEDEIESLQREKAELQSLLETHYCHQKVYPPAAAQTLPSYTTAQPSYTTAQPTYQPASTAQPPPYTATTPTFGEFFVKTEPETPSMEVDIDPFN